VNRQGTQLTFLMLESTVPGSEFQLRPPDRRLCAGGYGANAEDNSAARIFEFLRGAFDFAETLGFEFLPAA